jgi:regulator of sigma E protease
MAHYHHEVDKYLEGPAVVDYVPRNTPAARAGLSIGDTITRFENDVNPTWEQIATDCALNVNHTVPMSFVHNGQTITHDLTVLSGDNTSDPGPNMLTATGLVANEQSEPLSVLKVTADSVGERAGLLPDDGIVQIDSVKIHSFDTIVDYLQDTAGAPATLHILRNNQPLTLHVTPEKGDNGAGTIRYLVGFNAKHVPVEVQRLPFGRSIVQSFQDNKDDSKFILRILQGLFTRRVSVKNVSGPVGIAQQIEVAYDQGIWSLVQFTALISINLGIFNLLPIPILDGGMILFLIIESIMRRDVNEVLKERIYQAAFVCIILLAVFVFFNDITRMHGH